MIKFLLKKGYLFRIILLLFFLFSISACKKDFKEYWGDGGTKGGNLFERIKSNPKFSLFAEALDYSGLSTFLSKGGSYTVFAPTNEAFTKFLSEKGYTSVNQIPAAELFDICSYHVVQSLWYYHSLRDRYTNPNNNLYSQRQEYLTRSRKFVNIDVTTINTIKVNNIEVDKSLQDLDADNGVIHGVPQVLIPLPSLEELLNSDPDLANSVFVKMMNVLKDRVIDYVNSFDKNRDGKIDTAYFITYPLLNAGSNIAIEYKTAGATDPKVQGRPALTTILIPNNSVLLNYIRPVLARYPGYNASNPEETIKLLSPSYIESVLENYMLTDTSMTSAELKSRTGNLQLSNLSNMTSTSLRTDDKFQRKDIRASNGFIHIINETFVESPRQQSAFGKAMGDPRFSLFFKAMQKANQISTYGTTRSSTYLIPTNDAIITGGLDVDNLLLNGVPISGAPPSSSGASTLERLLKHHIVNASLPKASLTGTRATDFALGGSLIFSNNGNTVTNTNGMSAGVGPVLYVGPGAATSTDYVYALDKLLIPITLL